LSHYCPSDPNAQSRGPGNIAIIGSPREVARVALKILLTVAMALILSLESTAAILPAKSRQLRNRGRALSGSQVLPTICDAGRQSRSNHRSPLLAPATELRLSASLANSYRNRDQGSRTHSSFDAPWYHAAAAAEGWIVLATDATVRPRNDSVSWRLALLAAGWTWCITNGQSRANGGGVCGISGGAKCAQWLGAILAQTHSLTFADFSSAESMKTKCRGAENQRRASRISGLPIWISSGINDRIATPAQEQQIKGSLVRTGFQNVRLSRFSGGHEVIGLTCRARSNGSASRGTSNWAPTRPISGWVI